MRPMIRLYLLIFALVLIAGPVTALAGDGDPAMGAIFVPTGTMTLAVPPHIPAARSAVRFSHSGHFTYTCTTCHHTWDLASPVQGCSTAGCHDQARPPAAKGPKKEGIPYFRDAFHQSCRNCHRKMVRANKESLKAGAADKALAATGPVGCYACHPRMKGRPTGK